MKTIHGKKRDKLIEQYLKLEHKIKKDLMDYIRSKHDGFVVREEDYFYEIYDPKMGIVINCSFPDSPNFGFHQILYIGIRNQKTEVQDGYRWKFIEKSISDLYKTFFKKHLN